MECCLRLGSSTGLSLDTYSINKGRYPAGIGISEAQKNVRDNNLDLGY